jgi:hypothetical protein
MKLTTFSLFIAWISLAFISSNNAQQQPVNLPSSQGNQEQKANEAPEAVQFKGYAFELVSVKRGASWSQKDLNEWLRPYDDKSEICVNARNTFHKYNEVVEPKKRDHELIVVRLKVNLNDKPADLDLNTAEAQLRDGSGKLYPSFQVTKMTACMKPIIVFDVIFGLKKGITVRSLLLGAAELELKNL